VRDVVFLVRDGELLPGLGEDRRLQPVVPASMPSRLMGELLDGRPMTKVQRPRTKHRPLLLPNLQLPTSNLQPPTLSPLSRLRRHPLPDPRPAEIVPDQPTGAVVDDLLRGGDAADRAQRALVGLADFGGDIDLAMPRANCAGQVLLLDAGAAVAAREGCR